MDGDGEFIVIGYNAKGRYVPSRSGGPDMPLVFPRGKFMDACDRGDGVLYQEITILTQAEGDTQELRRLCGI